MPKSHHPKPNLAPPKRSYRMWVNVGLVVLVCGALVVLLLSNARNGSTLAPVSTQSSASTTGTTSDGELVLRHFKLSARDLVAMTDAELEDMDPLVMNLIVAKGVPDLAGIDFAKYVRVVDGWAERIGKGLAASEAEESRTSAAYKADPDIWRAGGMAIALASPAVGIAYTRDVRMSNHADLFVPGLIDTKRGTCSNLPVLYMAVADRLRWPLKAVVAADHMWCRWDDGKKQFNLEATSTSASDGEGSFSTPPDEAYRTDFNVSPKAVEVGSDMVTLTARQTLGVFLQQRAGYFRAIDKLAEAESDLLMARACFPQNRDIFRALFAVMYERSNTLFAPEELAKAFSVRIPEAEEPVTEPKSPVVSPAQRRAEQERLRQQTLEANRINQERQRQREREMAELR